MTSENRFGQNFNTDDIDFNDLIDKYDTNDVMDVLNQVHLDKVPENRSSNLSKNSIESLEKE